MARLVPMSSVDAAWLGMEDPTNLMMVTGVLMLDGKEIQRKPQPNSQGAEMDLLLSPGGKHVYYQVQGTGRYTLVMDGKDVLDASV